MNKEKITAAIAILGATYEAIQAAGSRGIPSGHLYAMLTGKMDLNTYQSMINVLKNQGLVTETGFLLVAKSPKAQPTVNA